MTPHQLLAAGGWIPPDPYWTSVRTLLHFDGSVTDLSTSAVAYALNSGAVLSSSLQLYGTGCLDCRASTDANCAGTAVALSMGAGDFCTEFWFKDSVEAANNQYIFLLQGVASAQTVRVYSPGANQLAVDVSGGGHAGTVAYSYGQWYHVAVTRSGNNWTFWLDGVAVKTWVNATFTTGGAATNFWLGSGSGAGTGLTILMDEFRHTVGVPRYTAPFSPSGPFPNY